MCQFGLLSLWSITNIIVEFLYTNTFIVENTNTCKHLQVLWPKRQVWMILDQNDIGSKLNIAKRNICEFSFYSIFYFCSSSAGWKDIFFDIFTITSSSLYP